MFLSIKFDAEARECVSKGKATCLSQILKFNTEHGKKTSKSC